MCNLTTVRKSAAEGARHFRVRTPPDVALNVPEETLPGYPGMVIREADGERVLESMVWGFPLRLKGSQALKHWRHEAAERPLQQLRELDGRGVFEIGPDDLHPDRQPGLRTPDRRHGRRQSGAGGGSSPDDVVGIGLALAVDVEAAGAHLGMIVLERRGRHRRAEHHPPLLLPRPPPRPPPRADRRRPRPLPPAPPRAAGRNRTRTPVPRPHL